MSDTTTHLGLKRDAVGVVQVLSQSVATVGPAAGVAGAIIVTTAYAGGSTPLAVVASLVGCLLVALSIGELSRHVSSAGGLYSYTAAGLGSRVAYLVGWGFLLAYALVPALLALILAQIVGGDLRAHLGAPEWIWIPLALAVCIIAWVANYRGVQVSTRLSVILASVEMAVFAVLSIALIVRAGHHNTFGVFAPNNGNAHGGGSVLTGMIYAIFGYLGFDAAASLGEEARAPKRTIRRAVIFSLLLVGAFYTLCYYAATVYFGPAKMASPTHGFLTLNGGDPWSGLAKELWSFGLVIVAVVIATSALGSANGGMSVSSRLIYSAARSAFLPRRLGRVHRSHLTPHIAVHFTGILSVVLVLLLGSNWVTGGVLAGVAFLATVVTILFVLTYILVCVSAIAFYARRRRDEWSIMRHAVLPAIGAAFFVAVLIAAFGIDLGGLGIAPLVGSARWAVPTVLGWLAVGVLALVVMSVRYPDRLTAFGKLFAGPAEPPPDDGAAPDTAPSPSRTIPTR